MYKQRKFHEPVTLHMARQLLLAIAADATKLFPRDVDKPLALYGAGNLGRMAYEYFARLGVPIQFVMDANAERLRNNDLYWSDKQLISPAEVSAEQKSRVLLAVCVVTTPYSGLARHLAAGGWGDVVPFYDIAEGFRQQHPLSNGWFASPFTSEDVGYINTMLEVWSDDVSRAHHLQFIAWRRLRQEWVFDAAPVTTDDRFFIPEVISRLTDDEAFADVGAHLGTVTQRFVENRCGRFRQTWAVEPDEQSLARLKITLASIGPEAHQHMEIIPAVVASDNSARKFFSGLGYASQCCSTGTIVSCRTIDELNMSPTYIKLHLEGMELEALCGAEQTIKHYRPIIAATTYHNSDGLWALPRWLHESLDDYEILMRVHSWCGTGAVVYAIPHERKILAVSEHEA